MNNLLVCTALCFHSKGESTSSRYFESGQYNCTDGTKFLCLDRMLKDVETNFRAILPHQDGILLRPALITHSAKKVSRKYKKLHQRSLSIQLCQYVLSVVIRKRTGALETV